ncbi:hypothetical protein [Heliorestis convoluta]|uniref:Putative membrane protein n=1 Tax=Heliorestis convoluta TaxID=356322 RepID=A0A5Q2N1Q4_9FIRM|nr:hypothetical protein [Heliorestis convoluta]QGG47222.1 putative membrane protein [Heliorestis convoluta]
MNHPKTLTKKLPLLTITILLLTTLFITGCNTKAPQSSTITPLEIPQEINELTPYLESHLPPEAQGNVNIGTKANGMYGTVAVVPLQKEKGNQEQIRQYARDFIFATYRTDFPIDVAAITVLHANGEQALTVIVGKNTEHFLDEEVWKENTMTTDDFFQWLTESRTSHDDPAQSIVLTE